MIDWKTVFTSKAPKDFNESSEFNSPQWLELKDHYLYSNKITEHSLHPKRLQSFYLSRLALKKALTSYLKKKNEDNFFSPHHLRMNSFSKLDFFPEVTISLSHTQSSTGAAAAAAILLQDDIHPEVENLSFKKPSSIGIDIEFRDRIVSNQVLKKVSHPQDIIQGRIENWCLKEAIYKCLMNSNIHVHSLSSIQIKQEKWIFHPSSNVSQQEIQGSWAINDQGNTIIALAY